MTYAFAACSGALLTAWRIIGRVPLWGWGFQALAVAVAYSRVYVGVHYLSDALCEVLLGVSVGWLVAAIIVMIGGREGFRRRSNPR